MPELPVQNRLSHRSFLKYILRDTLSSCPEGLHASLSKPFQHILSLVDVLFRDFTDTQYIPGL